jgi:hypothetical protein
MAWRILTSADVLNKFTANEVTLLKNSTGSVVDKLTTHLNDTIGKFLGAMSANGHRVTAGGAVPDQVRDNVLAYATWTWLNDFSELKTHCTDARKTAYEKACAVFDKLCQNTFGAVESPDGFSHMSSWQSKPKLVMRTDPVPSALQQLQIAPTPTTANPRGPQDGDNAVLPQ